MAAQPDQGRAARFRCTFPWGLTAAVAVCLPVLIGLGVWQVERLQWKTDLLARIERLKGAAPIPLEQALAEARRGVDASYLLVETDCPGLASAPWIELYSIHEGQPGSRLISACRTRQGSILVDRGFVADTISSRPPRSAADDKPVHVVGVLRAPDPPSVFRRNTPRRWFSRDIPAMAKALSGPAPAPYFLMAETSTNPEWKALDPAPLPSSIPNNHLGYAITWFGLALALAGVYAAALIARRRNPDSP